MDLAKPYLIELVVALGISVFARLVRLDRLTAAASLTWLQWTTRDPLRAAGGDRP